MRDRLIEILRQIDFDYSEECVCASEDGYRGVPDFAKFFADHLLAEGVIVPPVKVGQTVYCIRYDRARKPYVKPLGVLSITTYGKDVITLFTTRDDRLGLTAFLTREEAEKALERRSE